MKVLGTMNEEDLKVYQSGDEAKKEEIKQKYIKEFADAGGDDGGGDDVSSLSTGLRRINYKLMKANTPPKYTEVFGMVASLVAAFPLKSKIIWKAVADAFPARFAE